MLPSGPVSSVFTSVVSWQRQQRFPRPSGVSAPQARQRTSRGIVLQATQVG